MKSSVAPHGGKEISGCPWSLKTEGWRFRYHVGLVGTVWSWIIKVVQLIHKSRCTRSSCENMKITQLRVIIVPKARSSISFFRHKAAPLMSKRVVAFSRVQGGKTSKSSTERKCVELSLEHRNTYHCVTTFINLRQTFA